MTEIREVVNFVQMYKQWLTKRNDKHTLVKTQWELTGKCNFRCVHCYISGENACYTGEKELDCDQAIRLIDDICAEGGLFITFTGGEPLMRADFGTIYRYAHRKGFRISLFTNGALLDAEMVSLLRQHPPRIVSISLYGICGQTYGKITGDERNYARVMRGIELLVQNGIHVGLKTPILTHNVHEIEAIRQFVRTAIDDEPLFDPLLSYDLNCGSGPAQYRVDAETAAQIVVTSSRRREAERKRKRPDDKRMSSEEYLTKANEARLRKDDHHVVVSRCEGGLHNCLITPDGKLGVCSAFREPAYDLRTGSLAEGFHQVMRKFKETRMSGLSECSWCGYDPICHSCAGHAILETGDPEKPVPFMCDVSKRIAREFGLTDIAEKYSALLQERRRQFMSEPSMSGQGRSEGGMPWK